MVARLRVPQLYLCGLFVARDLMLALALGAATLRRRTE
jgi:hypothetical protein